MLLQKSSCFQLLLLRHFDISQGSVATHLRCDGIFSDSIITNFLLILIVNNFENRLIFDEVKAYKNVWATLYMVPYVHLTQHSKRHLDRFS